MKLKFKVITPYGRTIYCTKGRWYTHIVKNHKFMYKNMKWVVYTLKYPDHISNSLALKGLDIYVSCIPKISKNTAIKVVVKNIDSSTARVVTAFPIAYNKKENNGISI